MDLRQREDWKSGSNVCLTTSLSQPPKETTLINFPFEMKFFKFQIQLFGFSVLLMKFRGSYGSRIGFEGLTTQHSSTGIYVCEAEVKEGERKLKFNQSSGLLCNVRLYNSPAFC